MKLSNIVPRLQALALTSKISCMHSAALVSKKPIYYGVNHYRTSFKGKCCCAVHAEQAVINKYMPKSFRYNKNKWRFQIGTKVKEKT